MIESPFCGEFMGNDISEISKTVILKNQNRYPPKNKPLSVIPHVFPTHFINYNKRRSKSREK
jgi:hypothetical protein